ncbi:MAG: phosphate ABC transporter substrate-binding protein [Kiritimatiellae bacterium]|nr:phosphate ABC transporter substrate-binding protein [Kiritimatiellia bacterium]
MKKTRKITATLTMAIMIAGGTAVAKDAHKIVIDGSTTVGPIAKAFAEYYMAKHPEVNITVSESGSGNGAKGIINEACDIGAMSRPMKSSEIEAAKGAGVLPVEHIVAMDGIAVVVHNSNPVADLSVAQIKDIYTGKIANWKELGGPDLPIVAISRDTNSGTYETFESLVMKREKIAGKTEYVGSNGAIRQRVLSTPGAIGYVGLAFREGVKPVKVNGMEATPETVVAKTYPIARPLYMYTAGRPRPETPLSEFIDLANTPDGKKIIEDTGFVPLK